LTVVVKVVVWLGIGRGGLVNGDRLGVLVRDVVRLCVDFFVFFQILRPLEGFIANLTGVRLEWRMDCEIRSLASGLDLARDEE
jgi:hypothetical protein